MHFRRRWAVLAVTLAWLVPPVTAQTRPATQAGREIVAEVLGRPLYRDELPSERQPLDRITEYSSAISGRILGPLMQAYKQQHAAELKPTEAELAQAAASFDEANARTRLEQHADRVRRLHETEQQLADPQLDPARRQKLVMMRDLLEAETLPPAALEQKLRQIEQRLRELPEGSEERVALSIAKSNVETELRPRGRMMAERLLPAWKLQRHLYDHFGGGRILWQQFGVEAFDATRKWVENEERNGRLKFHDPHVRDAVYLYWTVSHGAFLTDDPKRIDEEFLNPRWMRPAPAATQPAR
jgi:hypothetical protein